MCLTNIDIVDDIDCLQVLQHADGSEKFLRVATRSVGWSIGPTIDGSPTIGSASAGGRCPASACHNKSERMQMKGWEYFDGNAWVEGDIRVTCITHA